MLRIAPLIQVWATFLIWGTGACSYISLMSRGVLVVISCDIMILDGGILHRQWSYLILPQVFNDRRKPTYNSSRDPRCMQDICQTVHSGSSSMVWMSIDQRRWPESAFTSTKNSSRSEKMIKRQLDPECGERSKC